MIPDLIDEVFVLNPQANKDDPPLFSDHPKVAGRIWWMKSLFYQIKRPIVKLRAQEDVIDTETGQQVFDVVIRKLTTSIKFNLYIF